MDNSNASTHRTRRRRLLPWIVTGLVALSLLTLAPKAEARAQVFVGIGIGVPVFAPPIYAYPYYPPPPPVVYAPAPYYGGPVYYYGPPRPVAWHRHWRGRGHGWGHRGHWD